MTEEQLRGIEAQLGRKLPVYYRTTVLAPPFRPIGRDWVYWLYDDPSLILHETEAPLAEGEYDRTNWRDTFLVIGQSAGGDLYLLDTALPTSPIYLLSHEDHQIEEEYPDWNAYLADWRETSSRLQQQEPERARQFRRAQWEAWIAIGVCFFSILLVLVLLLIGWLTHRL